MYELINVQPDSAGRANVAKEMSALLATLGSLIKKADMIFVWKNYYKPSEESMLYKEQVFEWERHNITADCSTINHRLDNVIMPPELETEMLADRAVHGPVAMMEDLYSRSLLEENGVKSSLMAAIFIRNKLWGALTLDNCTTEEDWSAEEIKTVKKYCNILSALIETNYVMRNNEDVAG